MNTQDHTMEISDLMMTGLRILHSMLDGESTKKIKFSEWCKMVQAARSNALNASQLMWLWDSIVSEPAISVHYGHRFYGTDQQWKDMVCEKEALTTGTELCLFLKGIQIRQALGKSSDHPLEFFPRLKLESPLFFASGKSRRLVCRDVEVCLTMRPSDLSDINEEARLLSINKQRISIDEYTGEVTARLPSLNMAYTVASRRLEPNRRNPGGRIYDHIAYRSEHHWIPLDDLREEHEQQLWKKLMEG